MPSAIRTNYFTYCWGVFEGGGVRGSALAGALQAAEEASVRFARVAGTSAGSIVAALVAAGADANSVLETLDAKEFKDFLQPAKPRDSIFESPAWLSAARWVPGAKAKIAARLLVDAGLYSSESIGEWVEERLKILLAPQSEELRHRPVAFKDLVLPLHVVATDLITGGPKVWSREETPDDSVAFAVRCSCTIPFFFQPVSTRQGAVYVDGGVLSNLPGFVFEKISGTIHRSLLSRILCFRLVEDPGALKIEDIVDLGLRLADAVVGGATEVQMVLQQGLHPVSIDTGSIRGTDFDSVGPEEKEWLRNRGYEKVTKFIAEERLHIRSSPMTRSYYGYDEMLLLLVQNLHRCERQLTIVGSNSYWLYFVFPALAFAARSGLRIDAVLEAPAPDDKHEAHRQRLLRLPGARIEHRAPPFEGFLFDPAEDHGQALVSTRRGTVGRDIGYKDEEVKLYSGFFDRPVLANFAELVQSPRAAAPEPLAPLDLPLEPCPPDDLLGRLRKVHQYRKADISIESVDVSADIHVLQYGVKEYKLIQIHQLVEEYRKNGFELFSPLRFKLTPTKSSIVTPPVLEKDGDTYTVIEGHTRFFYCWQHKESPIQAVVVKDAEGGLPGEPHPITGLGLTSGTRSQDELTHKLKESLKRPIEGKVHPLEDFLGD